MIIHDGNIRVLSHACLVCSGVLPQAVLPPTSDHTYAQWLQRAKIKEDACQLSPFKKVATPQKLPRIPMGESDNMSREAMIGLKERQ